jgi:hypothetical protein
VRDQPYDWSRSDFEIGNAASNGVQPFVFLSGAPPFAGATGDTAPVGSTDAQQGWQRFVAAAVQRYGPGGQFWAENPGLPNRPVRAWQIWNEQNAAFFWHPTPSPPDYAQLLKLSSSAIRSVDPNAQIVLGGMYGFPHLAGSIPMTGFLKRLYRIRSVRRHFDAVALHPYAGTVRAVKFQIDRARRIMDKFRDRRTPIWITELSWSTDGPPDWPLVTTPTRQAKLLKKSFKLLLKRRKSDRIRQVTWFAWRDNNDPECKWCPGAGLLDLQGNPKPSLSQFRRFTARTR